MQRYLTDKITDYIPHSATDTANMALKASATFCLLGLLLSQWTFATYIFYVYARSLLLGSPEMINQTGLITGHVVGDTIGNTLLFAHVIPAGLLSLSGILQLIPWLRQRFSYIHRFNGRFFLCMGLIGALSGLYLTWFRGSRLSDIAALGITLNGVLIPVAVMLAWRFARQRNFSQHARWAVQAFLLINGVLFFRLFLMAWYFINQGPNGNSNNLDGPMDMFLSFACYLVPMLFAELYFWASRRRTSIVLWSVTATLTVAGTLTFIGLLATVTMMWLPRIASF